MGREANCLCVWGLTRAETVVQLEGTELILRGAMRRRVPVSSVQSLAVAGECLCFEVSGEAVSLELGAAVAERWLKAFTKPAPSLASKLGITGETTVCFLGVSDEPALEEALGQAAVTSDTHGDLVVARVDTSEDLDAALKRAAKLAAPLCVVYPKGKGHAINEAAVREEARARGLVDVKVAAVSERLSALKFVHRKKAAA